MAIERKKESTGQTRKNQKSFKRISVLIPKKGQIDLSIQPALNTFFSSPRSLINYKNTKLLVKFISPQGKILSRRSTGLTAKQQRVMAKAIKQARIGGLLPFVNYELSGKSYL